jgi:hypothetical protein
MLTSCALSLFIIVFAAVINPTPSYAGGGGTGLCSLWPNGPYSSSRCDLPDPGEHLCGLCQYKCNVGSQHEFWCPGACIYKEDGQMCTGWYNDDCDETIDVDDCDID